MDDDIPTCPDCGTTFGSHETLRKHMAAIHKKGEEPVCPTAPAPSSSSSNKRPREADPDGAEHSEHVELEPLLGVLSEAQKDALIIRAVQADPEFYHKILDQARAVLTEEAADARMNTLDSEGVLAAIRWFTTIGVPANALTLLAAATERCLSALEALADCPAAGAADSSAAADEDEEDGGTGREGLLSAVEALPAAGALGALWVELLSKRAVAALIGTSSPEQAESMKLTLEGLQAAAATVRASDPGVLIGPNGEKVDTLADALEKLEKAFTQGAAAVPAKAGGKQARR